MVNDFYYRNAMSLCLCYRNSLAYDFRYRNVVANVSDCDIVVREFELKPYYYFHFQINIMGESIPPAMG